MVASGVGVVVDEEAAVAMTGKLQNDTTCTQLYRMDDLSYRQDQRRERRDRPY